MINFKAVMGKGFADFEKNRFEYYSALTPFCSKIYVLFISETLSDLHFSKKKIIFLFVCLFASFHKDIHN